MSWRELMAICGTCGHERGEHAWDGCTYLIACAARQYRCDCSCFSAIPQQHPQSVESGVALSGQ